MIELVDHIVEVTQGDFAAAARRRDEFDDLLKDIAGNPRSGMRLSEPLGGWLVRHGDRGHRITIVIRADPGRDELCVVLVVFGGQDRITEGAARREFGQ